VFLSCPVSNAQVEPSPVSDKSKDDFNAGQIIENNKPALVSIWLHTSGGYNYSYVYEDKDTVILNGSGFFLSEDGIIGTNFHVVESIDSILIKTSDGGFYNARLITVDTKNDIAILKISDTVDKKFSPVKLGDADELKVGQNIFAVGSPFGFEYTISEGIIAAIRDNEKVSFNDPVTYMPVEKVFDKVIQITAAISPGNSGGALFNPKGEVIGITTYSYGFYGNLNFATSINSLKKVLNNLNLDDIDKDENLLKKREENLFFANLKLADNFKQKVTGYWIYSKQKDTMKVIDSFVVKQDSLNKINLTKAYYYYDKCLDLKPDSFFVYQELMDLYVSVEDFKKAENLYTVIKEKFSSDSLLNTLSSSLARAYSTSKDYNKAILFYEKILKKDSADKFVQYQIASIYELRKDYKKALAGYDKIIKNDSTYTEAYVRAATIYYKIYKDRKKAKKYLNTALEREILNYGYAASSFDLFYYLGKIAVDEGRKMDAYMAYVELKSVYSYGAEDSKKKLELYRAIQNMNDN